MGIVKLPHHRSSDNVTLVMRLHILCRSLLEDLQIARSSALVMTSRRIRVIRRGGISDGTDAGVAVSLLLSGLSLGVTMTAWESAPWNRE